MNWQKITVVIINIVMIISIITLIFSVALSSKLLDNKEIDVITVASPRLRLEDPTKYAVDKDVQVKITNPTYSKSKIEISHAQLVLANDDINFIWFLIYSCITTVIFLIGLSIVKAIVKSANNPFISKNVWRIQWLGALLIMSEVIDQLQWWLVSDFIKSNFQFVGMQLERSEGINWTVLITGLFLMVLSQVFSNGLKLKEEQDLTI